MLINMRIFFFYIRIELGDLPLVKTTAHLYHRIIYNNKNSLMSSIIIGGWDKQLGPQVYAIPPSGALMPVADFYAAGSGSAVLKGFLETSYKENMTYNEARELLVKAISLSVTFDNFSGGGVRLTNINEEELKEEFIGVNEFPPLRAN